MHIRASKLALLGLGITFATCSMANGACEAVGGGTFNGKSVWTIDGAVGFESAELQVDADGAPNSYQTDGKGLSFTCDGLTAIGSTPSTDPAGWEEKCNTGWKQANASGDFSKLRIFGFETDANNVPLIQKGGDPLPGLGYISTTSVPVPDGPIGTQRHWVDATKIPYIVLSSSFVSKFGVGPGDPVVVYRPSSGAVVFGVYGDGGKLGEASVKLHQDLGNDPIVIRKGTPRAKRGLAEVTLTLVFPSGSTQPTVDTTEWLSQIETVTSGLLNDWGGEQRLQECAASW